ncbi:hypothetical protein D3C85_1791570 [compost metagenome]
MDVAEAHGTHGGGAAEYGGGHGAHVERRAQVASCYQEFLTGLGAAHAVPAEKQHAGGINQNDEYIQGHDRLLTR